MAFCDAQVDQDLTPTQRKDRMSACLSVARIHFNRHEADLKDTIDQIMNQHGVIIYPSRDVLGAQMNRVHPVGLVTVSRSGPSRSGYAVHTDGDDPELLFLYHPRTDA